MTNNNIKNFKDLLIWQKSKEITKNIYSLTKTLPKEEISGLNSQIRRAAFYVPSNFAEGCTSNKPKEFKPFLGISLGSLSELKTELEISKDVGYIADMKLLDKTINNLHEERAMTIALKNKL